MFAVNPGSWVYDFVFDNFFELDCSNDNTKSIIAEGWFSIQFFLAYTANKRNTIVCNGKVTL